MTSTRFTALLFSLALLLGLLSALDVVTSPIRQGDDLQAAEAARSGSWTCPTPSLGRGNSAHLVAAGPPNTTGIAAEVTYDRFVEGEVSRIGRAAPFAEQAVGVDVEATESGGVDGGVAVRWRRQPAAIGRVWDRQSDTGEGGLLAAPCIPGSSGTWYVPGLSTAGGAEATLVLANPFVGDASLEIGLATPDGPQQPILLENVVVPGRSTRTLLLNEHAPEARDVGVIVRTRSGRVVVEGVQSVNAAIGGIDGVASVAAASAGSDSWTIPWAASEPMELDDIEPIEIDPDAGADDDDDDDAEEEPAVVDVVRQDALPGEAASWIWVTNVGDDEAALLVTVHGPDGGELVDTGTEAILPPGTVRRISLDGLLPPDTPRVAVTVAAENGVPIVASVATQVADEEDESRTGLAVQLGAPATDAVWVLPGEAPEGRQSLAALVNTGGEDAVVAVSLWTSTGILRPEGVQELAVPAGTQRIIDLSEVVDATLRNQVVFVQAVTGRVVASRLGWAVEGDLQLVAHLGVPSAVWAGGTLVPTMRFDPTLTGKVAVEAPEATAPE